MDLISRREAIDVIDKIFPADPMHNEYTQGVTCGAALAMEFIKQLPSAEPKKGKWIKTGNKIEKGLREIWWFECSECGFRLRFPTDRTVFNYCPCCGAKNEVTE